MRKLLALAAALLLFPAAASAQVTISRSQTGDIGNIVTATDQSGASVKAVLPGVVMRDATGVEKGTAGNPVVTTPATGATSTVKIDQTTPGTTNGVVVNSGTLVVTQATAANNNAAVVGNVASGSADSGPPVKVGCKYNLTLPTFADAARGDCQITLRGHTIVAPLTGSSFGDGANKASFQGSATDAAGNPRITTVQGFYFNGSTLDQARGDANGAVNQPWAMASARWNYAAAASGIVNTTTAVTIKVAAGASVKNYLTSCQINHDTLGGATELAIRDGAAGTVLWRGKLQTVAAEQIPVSFESPLPGTANTLMEAATLTAVTGGVYLNCQGFIGS